MLEKLPLFLKPSEMMFHFALSQKEVERLKKEEIFKLDIHYHIPQGRSYAVWNTQALLNWATSSQNNDDIANKILKQFGL